MFFDNWGVTAERPVLPMGPAFLVYYARKKTSEDIEVILSEDAWNESFEREPNWQNHTYQEYVERIMARNKMPYIIDKRAMTRSGFEEDCALVESFEDFVGWFGPLTAE